MTTLQSGNHGLGGLHALGELLLRQAGFRPRLDHRTGQGKLRLQLLIGVAVRRVLHPLLMEVSHLGHDTTSLALSSASAISRRGVFWVFLTRSYWIPGSYVTRSSMSEPSNA